MKQELAFIASFAQSGLKRSSLLETRETIDNSMTVGFAVQIVTSNNTHPSPPFVITGTIHELQGTAPVADDVKQISYP